MRQRGRPTGQLQKMFEDAPYFTAHGFAFALAQILDLLGEVLAVEAVVVGAERAQHFGLVLRPGIEILVVIGSGRARSVGHGFAFEACPPLYAGRAAMSAPAPPGGPPRSRRGAGGWGGSGCATTTR